MYSIFTIRFIWYLIRNNYKQLSIVAAATGQITLRDSHKSVFLLRDLYGIYDDVYATTVYVCVCVCVCVCLWQLADMSIHPLIAAAAETAATGNATSKTTWPQLRAVNERQLGDHNKLKIMLP